MDKQKVAIWVEGVGLASKWVYIVPRLGETVIVEKREHIVTEVVHRPAHGFYDEPQVTVKMRRIEDQPTPEQILPPCPILKDTGGCRNCTWFATPECYATKGYRMEDGMQDKPAAPPPPPPKKFEGCGRPNCLKCEMIHKGKRDA